MLLQYHSVMKTLQNLYQKINIDGKIEFNVGMKEYTTFKTGGSADVFITPATKEDIITILRTAKNNGSGVFILGGGANILVSDKGIRGVVINMTEMKKYSVANNVFSAEAGLPISRASEISAESGLSGMEFIYSMPGSLGGAVYMNAKCYGISISEIIKEVEYIDGNFRIQRKERENLSFCYKSSPFQNTNNVILNASFLLKRKDRSAILAAMELNKNDRKEKGHFNFPCAGSVFKNNRSFGAPSGKIIDSLNLKGYRIGGAKIAEYHANIIINTGNACSSDIMKLIELIKKKVYDKTGFLLEREIQPVGDWRGFNEKSN